jgi:hypothetical protein
MRNANLNNYLNLLNEVYENGLINNYLCRKHKLNVNTYRAMKQLNYADSKGNSLMTEQPTIQDARKIIAQNKKSHNQYKSGQTEMKLAISSESKKEQKKQEKDARINLRFTKSEKNLLQKIAFDKSMSVADLIMSAVKHPIQEAQTQSKEISLFWGMIKIKR